MNDSLQVILGFAAGLALGGGGALWGMRHLQQREQALTDRFGSLAAESLRANNEAFLQLAETRLKQAEQSSSHTLSRHAEAFQALVTPMKESLTTLNTQVQAMEVKREGAYRELAEMVRLSHETQQQLRGETGRLLQALRAPTSRGQWGEIQLRRILEMTGMRDYTQDFSAQHSVAHDAGTLRPDFIVNLPGSRTIIIDSKVPLTAYLDATQTEDEGLRKAALIAHAKHVRDHVRALSSKTYWQHFEQSPEFVVLFMPGDHFLAAALDQDPELMDLAVTERVILATPMTLVALLRTIAYGWRQESLHENTKKIGALGGELYAAITVMTEHISTLGTRLTASVESYNKFIGSLERNVLSKARRLRDFGAGKDGKTLPDPVEGITQTTRRLEGEEAPLSPTLPPTVSVQGTGQDRDVA